MAFFSRIQLDDFSETYERGIALFPYPGSFFPDPSSSIHLALLMLEKMADDPLPNEWCDLTPVHKIAFVVFIQHFEGKPIPKSLKKALDQGVFEALESLPVLSNSIVGAKALDEGSYKDSFQVVNEYVFSGSQLAAEARNIFIQTSKQYSGELEGDEILTFFNEYRVPELWHMYMTHANYDLGMFDVLSWIFSQSDCDLGSVLFFLNRTCQPQYAQSKWSEPYNALVPLVFENTMNGLYRRFKCPVDFDHPSFLRTEVTELEKLDERPPSFWFQAIEEISKREVEAEHFQVPHSVFEGTLRLFPMCEAYGPVELKAAIEDPKKRARLASDLLEKPNVSVSTNKHPARAQ